jgi:hypothetical protein
MWSHKIKTYEEDLEHFVIQEHKQKFGGIRLERDFW